MAGFFDFGDTEDDKRERIGLLGLLAGGQMMAANQPGASMGQVFGAGTSAFGQNLMQMNQQRGLQALRALQMQKLQAEVKNLGTKAPDTTEAFDPQGRKIKMQWDPTEGKYVPLGNAQVERGSVPWYVTGGPESGYGMAPGAASAISGESAAQAAGSTPYKIQENLAGQGMVATPQGMVPMAGYASAAGSIAGAKAAGTAAATMPFDISKSLASQGLQFNPATNMVTPIPGYSPAKAAQAADATTATNAAEIPFKQLMEDYKANLELQNAGPKAASILTSKAKAQAAIDLPKTIDQAEQSIKLIDDLIKHPGLKDVVGMPESVSGLSTKVLGTPLPGTNAAGFKARLDQLSGQQFLQAFETLKGGGSITEVEGKKATDAISRLQKTGLSEKEYKEAAEEFKEVIRTGVNRAIRAAGKGTNDGWSIQRVR